MLSRLPYSSMTCWSTLVIMSAAAMAADISAEAVPYQMSLAPELFGIVASCIPVSCLAGICETSCKACKVVQSGMWQSSAILSTLMLRDVGRARQSYSVGRVDVPPWIHQQLRSQARRSTVCHDHTFLSQNKRKVHVRSAMAWPGGIWPHLEHMYVRGKERPGCLRLPSENDGWAATTQSGAVYPDFAFLKFLAGPTPEFHSDHTSSALTVTTRLPSHDTVCRLQLTTSLVPYHPADGPDDMSMPRSWPCDWARLDFPDPAPLLLAPLHPTACHA